LREVRFRGRYWGQSGHGLVQCKCPLLTQSGQTRGDLDQLGRKEP